MWTPDDLNPLNIVTLGAYNKQQGAIGAEQQALRDAMEAQRRWKEQEAAAAAGADQSRGFQGEAAGLARSAALGLQPSAAEIALQRGVDAAASGGYANAAANAGVNPLAAQRLAGQQAQQAALQASGAGAQLRAGEMATARGEYGGQVANIRAQDEARRAGLAGNQLAAGGQRIGGQANIAGQYGQQGAQITGALASGGASLLGGGGAEPLTRTREIISDRRAKTDVGGGNDEAEQLLDALHAFVYRYRGGMGEADPGEHLGVMAQDLERSPMGRQAVDRGPGGMRSIDPSEALGPILASLANLHGRLRGMEGGR